MNAEDGFYTGLEGFSDLYVRIFGKKYLVTVDYNDNKFVHTDLSEEGVKQALNLLNISEWTFMLAMSEEQAKRYCFSAHNQWYDHTNGLKDWKRSATLGIRT